MNNRPKVAETCPQKALPPALRQLETVRPTRSQRVKIPKAIVPRPIANHRVLRGALKNGSLSPSPHKRKRAASIYFLDAFTLARGAR